LFDSEGIAMIPDFRQANADLRSLTRLTALYRFDLYEYLRLLSEAGAPLFCADVDDISAVTARRAVVHYKLSDGLLVVLAAFRARKLNYHKVKRRSGAFSALPNKARSFGGSHVVS
jgi:hypothetical protein